METFFIAWQDLFCGKGEIITECLS